MLYIWQGSEYTLIKRYLKVLNIIGFWICQGYTGLSRKLYTIDAWQGSEYFVNSEYVRVLNMSGLHKVQDKNAQL